MYFLILIGTPPPPPKQNFPNVLSTNYLIKYFNLKILNIKLKYFKIGKCIWEAYNIEISTYNNLFLYILVYCILFQT